MRPHIDFTRVKLFRLLKRLSFGGSRIGKKRRSIVSSTHMRGFLKEFLPDFTDAKPDNSSSSFTSLKEEMLVIS
jgi:hypothetical protein